MCIRDRHFPRTEHDGSDQVRAVPRLVYPPARAVRAFQSVCEYQTWYLPMDLIGENPAPSARQSLAQHGAAGGVLGRVGNRSESLQGRHSSHTPSSGPHYPRKRDIPILETPELSAIELGDGGDHALLLVLAQFGEHRQGQYFFRRALRLRKIARFIAQVSKAWLQVQRDGIVDFGSDALLG